MIYTFRTFPALTELQKLDSDVFVFSRLKEDIRIFEELVVQKQPTYILGVALTKGQSRIEPVTINKFNGGRVHTVGPAVLDLYVPPTLPMGLAASSKATHSFCNWTMYRVQHFVDQKSLSIKCMFIHVNARDLCLLSKLLAK